MYNARMKPNTRVEELRRWRAEARQELDKAQAKLASLQKQIEETQERIKLIDQLLTLEESGNFANTRNSRADSDVLLDACERLLRDAGKPLHIKELQAALLEEGIPLPGRGTEANLIVRLRRSNGRFIRTGRGTYGLPEFGLPEVTPVRRRKTTKQRSSDG